MKYLVQITRVQKDPETKGMTNLEYLDYCMKKDAVNLGWLKGPLEAGDVALKLDEENTELETRDSFDPHIWYQLALTELSGLCYENSVDRFFYNEAMPEETYRLKMLQAFPGHKMMVSEWSSTLDRFEDGLAKSIYDSLTELIKELLVPEEEKVETAMKEIIKGFAYGIHIEYPSALNGQNVKVHVFRGTTPENSVHIFTVARTTDEDSNDIGGVIHY